MKQEQLIRSIEQQLENLAHFDGDLAYDYECNLYYADKIDEPIKELFTSELLEELIQTISNITDKTT